MTGSGASWGDRIENGDGVHLTNGEFTLCGDAWDAPDSEPDWEPGEFRKPKSRIITCAKCVAIVLLCRGVRVAERS